MSLRIACLGYGEVGHLFAREWLANGVAVAAYDVKPALAEVAARDAIRFAASPEAALDGADIVVSAVTADSAVAAARSAAPFLAIGQLYIDLNSVSPSTKREVRAALNGADFVEWAVMSPVAGLGIRSPILAGGARAAETAVRLNALGMKIDAVSEEIGVASATKLCRSIVIKGLEAIMVDLSQAAPQAGVMEAVLKSLAASYPGMDWAEIVRYMPPRVARHGVRRAAEMREAGKMLDEMGLSGDFCRGIADRHETYARKG